MDDVLQHLDILEKDYFGLAYRDDGVTVSMHGCCIVIRFVGVLSYMHSPLQNAVAIGPTGSL